jgi:hypothetical protein
MTREEAIAFNNYRISSEIMTARIAGKTVQDAFDSVLGDGAYDKLAGEVYDELRGKK